MDSKVGSLLFKLQLCKGELETVKKELKSLKKALPSFPSPRVLYDKIIDIARDVMLCSNSLDDIRKNIPSLTNFTGKWNELEKDVQLLEAKTENCEIQLFLLRTTLRTSYAIVPLLIATKQIFKGGMGCDADTATISLPGWQETLAPSRAGSRRQHH
ncbi:hypothetical protein GCK32_014656 [Trichostrongylus colubriformis]|uniref:Uncharacterized protein n=1 Tax=Trichostrongylus colubriformis TaxID=6319 RepID=A0AAN8ICW5_TRICO